MSYFTDLDEDGWTALVSAGGAIIKRTMVRKAQILFVPSGWIALELSCPDGLCYGLRQSAYKKTPSIMGHFLQCYKDSGKAQSFVEKMERVLEHASA